MMVNKTTHSNDNSKFINLGEILKQPIKKYQLQFTNPNDLKGIKSDIYIRCEYQNIYSIFGKIEIENSKPTIPTFILPNNMESDRTTIIHAYFLVEKKFNIIHGIIQGKYLTFYPGNNMKPNVKNIIEFNNLVCLPANL